MLERNLYSVTYKHCRNCNREILKHDEHCPYCGVSQQSRANKILVAAFLVASAAFVIWLEL